jgi:hypothetical protein
MYSVKENGNSNLRSLIFKSNADSSAYFVWAKSDLDCPRYL